MDIDKIIEGVAEEARKKNIPENTRNFYRSEKLENDFDGFGGCLLDEKRKSIEELLKLDLTNEDVKTEIYKTILEDIEAIIAGYLEKSTDVNAEKGMQKCYLETWQDCANYIGVYYFKSNKLLHDKERERKEGGTRYNEVLLNITLEIYETLCSKYRKQFFIYDALRFMGIDKDYMYKLSEMHSRLAKKAHTAQEASYRTALASGRSNVTAMAILLNHDYDYTRTTQVIHTNERQQIGAEHLPQLMTQDIVVEQIGAAGQDQAENL